jgi:DNA polymerase-3 subunit delta'
MSLVVHPSSALLINALEKDLPQALLLGGDTGVGLSTIALQIAETHTKHPIVILPEKDDKVDLEKGSIGIELIRRLYGQTRAKQASLQIYIFDYADRMTRQAQNAFLKLLEEPNESTRFILVAHQPDMLLPTVRSRAQLLTVHRATSAQSQEFLDALQVQDRTKRAQLLFMADGRPAELFRLAHDDAYFNERARIIRDARTLLQGAPYERLMIAHAYRDNRSNSLLLLEDTIAIARRTLSQNYQQSIVEYLERLMSAYAKVESNGNIRLALAALMV